MKSEQKSYLYALTAILLWSTVATAFKISLEGLDFIQLLLYSSFTSAVMLFILIILLKKLYLLKEFLRNKLLKGLLMGLLNPFIYYSVLFKSYSILPAQEAMILNYTWPIMLVLLSVLFLKQSVSLLNLIAIIVSFAGIAVIATHGNLNDFRFTNITGDLLALGSSVIWALFWILNMHDKHDIHIKLFVSFFIGFIFSVILTIFFSEFRFPETRYMLATIYIGLFEMSITFTLWLHALQLSKTADKISNLAFLSPFLSLVFISLVLGEEIQLSSIIGLLMIVSSIVITRLLAKKKSFQV